MAWQRCAQVLARDGAAGRDETPVRLDRALQKTRTGIVKLWQAATANIWTKQYPFHPPDATDRFWTQQTRVGRLVGQAAHCGEPNVNCGCGELGGRSGQRPAKILQVVLSVQDPYPS